VDTEGLSDGCTLSLGDGFVVGRCDAEGCRDDTRVGAELTDGGTDNVDVGRPVTEGTSLGVELDGDDGRAEGPIDGWTVEIIDGLPEELGNLLGRAVGQSETEGFVDGRTLGMLDSEGCKEGWTLGPDDGCDVGQCEAEG